MLQWSSRLATTIGICVAAAGFALDLLPSAPGHEFNAAAGHPDGLVHRLASDLREPGTEYWRAADLFEELGISYITPIEILDAASDYAPDWHWNNSGHLKVGALLSDCVDKFVSQRKLNDCSHVVLPLDR